MEFLKMVSLKQCSYCRKEIGIYEKYTLLGTCKKEKGEDVFDYFHFDCWKEFFNDCVQKRMKGKELMKDQINKINGMLKKFIKNAKRKD